MKQDALPNWLNNELRNIPHKNSVVCECELCMIKQSFNDGVVHTWELIQKRINKVKKDVKSDEEDCCLTSDEFCEIIEQCLEGE